MEEILSSETSVNFYPTIQRHIPEDNTLYETVVHIDMGAG
jgi:hypothetical protein